MVTLASLWLPIVLSAVGVFVVSSLIHMALPIHKSDYRRLPREAETMEQLRRDALTPGIYAMPFCNSSQEMSAADTREKFEKGPVGMLIVRPTGMPSMGGFLGQWFGYCLVVSFFTAYLAAHTLAAGAHYLAVFRVVGTCAFMAYGIGCLPSSIWGGHPWSVTAKHVVDGLIYGCVTAGFFGWLWVR